MTWWMITLCVVGYIFIAGVTAGIASVECEEGAIFIGILWPLTLAGIVVLSALYLPYILGERIYDKIYDLVHKHDDI